MRQKAFFHLTLEFLLITINNLRKTAQLPYANISPIIATNWWSVLANLCLRNVVHVMVALGISPQPMIQRDISPLLALFPEVKNGD